MAPQFTNRLGILGAGQLAKMLVEAGAPMGFFPAVLAESERDPAARLSREVVLGNFREATVLRDFLSKTDEVIFENEFLNFDVLEKVAQEFPKLRFHPPIGTMRRLSDKLVQKQTCVQLKLPTAPFLAFAPGDEPAEWLSRARTALGSDLVLKWGSMGYDGKGLLFLKATDANEKAFPFIESAIQRGANVYAEKRSSFRRELALTACRDEKGNLVTYPLVITEQTHGICDTVMGPATEWGVSPLQEQKAQAIARALGEALQIEGVFALEFFEEENGELLVNEMAPRVHNSSHFTQNASETSQFENHWRATLGMEMGSTSTRGFFAMLNLLGPVGVDRKDNRFSLPKLPGNMHLHWYAKEGIRPGRKIGHINVLANSRTELESALETLHVLRRDWENSLRTENK